MTAAEASRIGHAALSGRGAGFTQVLIKCAHAGAPQRTRLAQIRAIGRLAPATPTRQATVAGFIKVRVGHAFALTTPIEDEQSDATERDPINPPNVEPESTEVEVSKFPPDQQATAQFGGVFSQTTKEPDVEPMEDSYSEKSEEAKL